MTASKEYWLLIKIIDFAERAENAVTSAQSDSYIAQALELMYELKGMIVVRDDMRLRDLTVEELMRDG